MLVPMIILILEILNDITETKETFCTIFSNGFLTEALHMRNYSQHYVLVDKIIKKNIKIC